MATLTSTLPDFDMTDLPLIDVQDVLMATSTEFRGISASGALGVITGSGFTYAGERPTGGTVTAFTLTVGGNSVSVTGASASIAAMFTAGQVSFYSVLLAGSDTGNGGAGIDADPAR